MMTYSWSHSISRGRILRIRATVVGFQAVAILAALLGCVSVSHEAEAVSLSGTITVGLSGTIRYSGALGPVSADRPIQIQFRDTPSLGDKSVAVATVTTNGGPWTVELPQAGNYYLVYWLDLNDDGETSIGEPVEIYNNKFGFDAVPDPLAAPQSGVALDFDDTWLPPGVTGTITYTGNYPVPPGRSVGVLSYGDPGLTGDAFVSPATNGAPFQAFLLETPGYLRAHLDLIGNNDEYDPGEPFVIYNHRGVPPGDPVMPGAVINFVFGDEYAPSSTHLSGTVSYSGSRGPVSASRPIVMLLLADPNSLSELGRRTITSNDTPFDIALMAAGQYSLLTALDVNNDGILVGAPFQLYNGKLQFPADPITAPASGIPLAFNDAARIPGIAGTATYTGSLGGVSHRRQIIIDAFADPEFTRQALETDVETNGGRYGLVTGHLESPLLYLRVYLDTNHNHQPDPGEPLATCGAPIQAGPDQTNVAIAFGDGGAATCAVSALCVGDCNNDHSVTVNEILTMVNIALGNTPVTTCEAGDANHDSQITVDEILAAVNNALNGCG
jgi:hypothetical protein